MAALTTERHMKLTERQLAAVKAKAWRRRLIGDLAAYVILGTGVLIALFPIFWTFSTSVKQRVDTFVLPPKFFAFDPTLKNYVAIFNTAGFAKIYWNTIVITLASTLLCVAVSTLMAYALARSPRFRSRGSLEVSLILVRAVPAIVIMVPLFKIISHLGLYDNHLMLIVMYAAVNVPFATWLMTSFVEQIPVSLEQSAAIDGASRLQILGLIVLPLLLPGLAATTIITGLVTWNEFLIPVMLAGNDAKTLPVFIAGFISARNLDWGPMAAASSLAIIPIAILTVLAQRKLVSGLASGAIKG
jgi:ABC-type glycerol-3-phosphate transport system permease component